MNEVDAEVRQNEYGILKLIQTFSDNFHAPIHYNAQNHLPNKHFKKVFNQLALQV